MPRRGQDLQPRELGEGRRPRRRRRRRVAVERGQRPSARRRRSSPRSSCDSPASCAALGDLLVESRLDAWRDWLAWQVVHGYAPFLSSAFVNENFDFYGRTLTGTEALRERWKRGVAFVEGAMGEAVGKIYVERHFAPAAKERMDGLVANLIAAYRESISGLEWMTRRDAPARPRQARRLHAQDRLPAEVARLLQARRGRRRPHRQRARRRRVRARAQPRQDRRADRPRRVVHDAPDGQRLLQPRDERDRLSRGVPPAAELRPRTPTTRPTTAPSARSSATRSVTASTTRGRATTARAASPTGGRPRTARPSRSARAR